MSLHERTVRQKYSVYGVNPGSTLRLSFSILTRIIPQGSVSRTFSFCWRAKFLLPCPFCIHVSRASRLDLLHHTPLPFFRQGQRTSPARKSYALDRYTRYTVEEVGILKKSPIVTVIARLLSTIFATMK